MQMIDRENAEAEQAEVDMQVAEVREIAQELESACRMMYEHLSDDAPAAVHDVAFDVMQKLREIYGY